MQVFKFGGASVKDASGVKNVVRILKKTDPTAKVVVISAMGKMTNAFESVVNQYFEDKKLPQNTIDSIADFHLSISRQIFESNHPIHQKIKNFIAELEEYLYHNKSTNYDYLYDQVVAYGELISTTIVSDYLFLQNIKNTWIDVRGLIKTDSTYRDAKVNWEMTEKLIIDQITYRNLTITQGFIAADENNWTTTLGREGSDYTAGILAYCLDAEEVCIWKNVEGVLNADPREFSETTPLEHISYQEAIELAFYGASVIHPKTLQPLQRKEIPLFVKSFSQPEKQGTSVSKGVEIFPKIPCFIVKKDLLLLSLSTLDFSFFVEENISEVFALFHRYQIKVDLIQNSAISFSVCVTDKFRKAEALMSQLQGKFKVTYNNNVSLYTIRHFDNNAIAKIRNSKIVLLEQRTRETVQLITKS